MKKHLLNRRALLIVVGVVGLAAITAPSYYFYNRYQQAQNQAGNLSSGSNEVAMLVEKVGAHMDIPKGEAPTVATVSDKTKLLDQPFFAKADNGDKVLIFQGAKKAILYRPKTDKIIEVAPINLPGNQDSSASAAVAGAQDDKASSEPIKVVLLNGTTKTGLTRTAENKLKEQFKNVQIVERSNASEQDYKETLVVDLTDTNRKIADSISKALGGKVESLPKEESIPKEGQILIILGENFK